MGGSVRRSAATGRTIAYGAERPPGQTLPRLNSCRREKTGIVVVYAKLCFKLCKPMRKVISARLRLWLICGKDRV